MHQELALIGQPIVDGRFEWTDGVARYPVDYRTVTRWGGQQAFPEPEEVFTDQRDVPFVEPSLVDLRAGDPIEPLVSCF